VGTNTCPPSFTHNQTSLPSLAVHSDNTAVFSIPPGRGLCPFAIQSFFANFPYSGSLPIPQEITGFCLSWQRALLSLHPPGQALILHATLHIHSACLSSFIFHSHLLSLLCFSAQVSLNQALRVPSKVP
jgi:hypothetical protein